MKKLICTWRTVKQIHPCSKSSDFIGITSGKKKKKKSHSIYSLLYRRMPFIKVIFPFVALLLTYFIIWVAKMNDKGEDEHMTPCFFNSEVLIQRNLISWNISLKLTCKIKYKPSCRDCKLWDYKQNFTKVLF